MVKQIRIAAMKSRILVIYDMPAFFDTCSNVFFNVQVKMNLCWQNLLECFDIQNWNPFSYENDISDKMKNKVVNKFLEDRVHYAV